MKKVISIVISVLVFLLGLGIMFYPTVSNWLHEQNASYAVSNYQEQVGNKSTEEYDATFAAARAYNATLTGDVLSFLDAGTEFGNPDYWNILDEVNGIMGVIEIPSINVTLPIYHGSEEEVLQKGAGHLEGSALPTGDVGNHTVITGHTGLPTAMLFTDLDELVIGDYFYLDILNEVFAYEVVNIYVVLPSETEYLMAQADKDLVTLVTCTPYGVNSHRLLIQGERTQTPTATDLTPTSSQEVVTDTSHALDNLPLLIAVAGGFALALVVAIVVFLVRGAIRPKRLAGYKKAKQQAKEQGKLRKKRTREKRLEDAEDYPL